MVVTGREDGPVIVLAHGFGCDQNMWRLVAPALGASDFRVVLFDHVGAGGSDLSAWTSRSGTPSLDGYAEDVLEICRELDLREVVFVGHSVSAMIGVLAAARGAEPVRRAGAARAVAALHRRRRTIAAGSADADIDELLESLESNYLGWSAAMAPVIMGNPDRPELGEELTNSFCRTDPRDRAGLRAGHVPVRQPCRPARGHRADAGAPVRPGRDRPAGGRRVRPRRRSPGSKLVTLDATGHCPQLSAPEATAEAIAAFAAALR